MAIDPAITQICPQCAIKIPKAARRCPHCRTMLGSYGATVGFIALLIVGLGAWWFYHFFKALLVR